MSSVIISVVNQKGGVGKTTTTMNLAAALCAMQKKVLVIDFDPQSNSTSGLGIYRQDIKYTTYDLMLKVQPLSKIALPTNIPGLLIIASSMDLSGIEIELASAENKALYLKEVLSESNCESLGIDYVLIDCPPSLGILTLNALVACKELLIPLQCEYFALEGLSHLVRTIDIVKKHLNPLLEIKGILLTMYDSRNNLSKMVSEDVRKYYGSMVYNTVIPRNVKISEAPSHGYPVIIYDPKCTGSQAYISLASEIILQDKELFDI